MKFSQRIGKTRLKETLERDNISQELLNSLWTFVLESVFGSKKEKPKDNAKYSEQTDFFRALWIQFYKWPIDELEMNNGQVDYDTNIEEIRLDFFNTEWYLVLDFIEFCVKYDKNKFSKMCNDILQEEMSAYRFVNGNLVELTSKEEIIEIENAVANTDEFQSVNQHLNRALELYSDRKTPDYRNSIKESISSVEALSKIILGNDKTTLGQALNEIEKKYNLPSQKHKKCI